MGTQIGYDIGVGTVKFLNENSELGRLDVAHTFTVPRPLGGLRIRNLDMTTKTQDAPGQTVRGGEA